MTHLIWHASAVSASTACATATAAAAVSSVACESAARDSDRSFSGDDVSGQALAERFDVSRSAVWKAVNALRAAGINPGIVHAANSAAAIRYPEVQLDMVRLGISLYGFYPCPEAYPMIDLKPAMSVKARITDVKTLPVGEGVSYGLNYRSPGAVKICTMPIGYADGFRRGLSGRTDVLLAGRRFHQVGNICMDQSMFEVNLRQRNDLDPQIGDTVTIVGEQGEASVTIDQMAETLGTIQHEVAIGFGCSRLPRLYV